ncbi:MAG: hypothetical protein JXA11_03380 [Phycisphaerae bacterium]|nr:hypothetical protein [Phycisphaerae bacterium]
MDNVFADEKGAPRVVRGAVLYSGSRLLAELAGRVGFETIWIEMEHGPTNFETVEGLCLAAEAGGAVPSVRVSDSQRCHILRALEVGGRIIIVPMVNTAEQAQSVVEYGKFPPLGKRGYNTRSRGVHFSLDGPQPAFAEANERTHLFVQIETRQAVENLDEILAVEGLSGIFIGPGDLSASLGRTGDLNCPEVVDVVTDCIRRARKAGKHAGILVSPGALLTAALEAGCDLAFFAGDVMNLVTTWPEILAAVKTQS